MTDATITVEDLVSPQADRTLKLVKFSGQLDESNVDEKAKPLYQLIDANGDNLHLIFDLSELDYMNSKAIGYLTDWYTKLSEKKGGIVIASAKPNILDILQVVGLTKLIPCVNSLDEAKVQAMKS